MVYFEYIPSNTSGGEVVIKPIGGYKGDFRCLSIYEAEGCFDILSYKKNDRYRTFDIRPWNLLRPWSLPPRGTSDSCRNNFNREYYRLSQFSEQDLQKLGRIIKIKLEDLLSVAEAERQILVEARSKLVPRL